MVHVALGDSVGGLNGAAALLTALRHQRRTGQGQHLDLSQSQALFPLGVQGILAQSAQGEAPPRLGNRSATQAPHGVYPCAGDDEWIVLQARTEAEWRAFADYAGIDGFGDLADRLARVDELDRAVEDFTAGQVAWLLMPALQELGVPAAAVASGLELGVDPHLVERRFFKEMERPCVGPILHPAAPYRVGDAPFDIDSPAPTLGQHNREVLRELLNLDEEEMDDLARRGVIGDKPRLP